MSKTYKQFVTEANSGWHFNQGKREIDKEWEKKTGYKPEPFGGGKSERDAWKENKPKKVKKVIKPKKVTEAIGNKYTSHQVLSKHGYEHGGNDEYFKKDSPNTVKLGKGNDWQHGVVKGKGSLSLAKRMRDLDKLDKSFKKA